MNCRSREAHQHFLNTVSRKNPLPCPGYGCPIFSSFLRILHDIFFLNQKHMLDIFFGICKTPHQKSNGPPLIRNLLIMFVNFPCVNSARQFRTKHLPENPCQLFACLSYCNASEIELNKMKQSKPVRTFSFIGNPQSYGKN